MAYRRLMAIEYWRADILGSDLAIDERPLQWRGCPILDGDSWDYAT